MSGGSFDYAYWKIEEFSRELRNRLNGTGQDEDGCGEPKQEWPEPVKNTLLEIADLSEKLSKLAKEVEWLYAGDTGPESFMENIGEIINTKGYKQ